MFGQCGNRVVDHNRAGSGRHSGGMVAALGDAQWIEAVADAMGVGRRIVAD